MSSLSGEEVKLVREVWDSVCGSAEGLTQAGVQLFLKLVNQSVPQSVIPVEHSVCDASGEMPLLCVQCPLDNEDKHS